MTGGWQRSKGEQGRVKVRERANQVRQLGLEHTMQVSADAPEFLWPCSTHWLFAVALDHIWIPRSLEPERIHALSGETSTDKT